MADIYGVNTETENISEANNHNITVLRAVTETEQISEIIDYTIPNTSITQSLQRDERISEIPVFKITEYKKGLQWWFKDIPYTNTFSETQLFEDDLCIYPYIITKYNRQFKPIKQVDGTAIYTEDFIPLFVDISPEFFKIIDCDKQLTTQVGNFCFDVGLLLSNKTVYSTMLSGYKEDLVVDSLIIPPHLGIDLVDIAPGDTLLAGGSYTFGVLFYRDKGQLTLEGDMFTIVFTNGLKVSYCINLYRQTERVYSFQPDKNTYSELSQFYTIMYKSGKGLEYRKPKIVSPKKKIKYSVTLHDLSDFEVATQLRVYATQDLVYQPLWASCIKITGSGTTTTIPTEDTTYSEFKVGGYVCIWKSDTVVAASRITAIYQNEIHTAQAVEIEEGDFIMPLVKVLDSKTRPSTYQHATKQKIDYDLRTLE